MIDAEATRKAVGPIGRSMRRKEDPRLITGRGRYVDDIVLPGTVYAAIVRSSEAHARIVSVDSSEALARPGVLAAASASDLEILRPLPMIWNPPGVTMRTPEHWPLARGAVKHVGDPVAVVVGEGRYAVTDAAEGVVVEYEPLLAVVDPEAALKDGSPLVHEHLGTNTTHEWSLGSSSADVEAALRDSDVVVERRIVNHRTAGAAIEPRGVLADWRADSLTLWTSTQIPHLVRLFLAEELGIGEGKIRVIAPDVGGGFGSKLNHYAEEVLACALTRKLERPVKWIETRSENLMATTHGRDMIAYARMGTTRDGTLTALHVRLVADLGAYQQLITPLMPTLAAFAMCGCYRTPVVRVDTIGVFTNKVAVDSVRGAGRPEATHLIEVMMDQTAAELRLDPLQLRRKNFIPKADFPARVALGVTYDSGDYHASLDRLLEMVDVDAFRHEQRELRERGVYRGIGFSTYVELGGLAPTRIVGPMHLGLQRGFLESATVRVHPSGAVTAYTGTSPHGQGGETALAQIVADRLGIEPDQVKVVHGDTDAGPFGMGTYGSRGIPVGGEAALRAADKVVEKAKRIAAHMLAASPDGIELADQHFHVRGSPGSMLTLAEIAETAYVPEGLPLDIEPGLDETAFFDPADFVWPFGAHAAIVEVDVETGKVALIRFVAVDDCGRVINPLLVDGQIHGGVAHSVGQALYERIHYDQRGQLVTGTFVDYGLPTAAELPSFETDRTETPSPLNTLGTKGAGEAGAIGCTPTLVNAVVDALRPLGVTYLDMPLTPLRVWHAIEQERGQAPPP
jgi:aerobic carbon-monoxide dehydrogenase large subunit